MPQLNLIVTACARLRSHGSLTMRLMTGEAGLIGVDSDGRMISLRRMVTAQTFRGTLKVPRRAAPIGGQRKRLRRSKLVARHALARFSRARVVSRQIMARHTEFGVGTAQFGARCIVALFAQKALTQMRLMPG